MLTHNDMIHYKALKALSETEIRKMEHCIGWNKDKAYTRNGVKYFKPYRNHFNPGGADKDIWAGLKEKGFADCVRYENGEFNYWVNHQGLNILSAVEEVFIYSDNASGNVIDATADVIEVLLDDAVYCGYGCWLPTSGKSISLRGRLPYKLTLETIKHLSKEGYVLHCYEGGCDDEGYPHCTHGYVLSKKWIDEHKEEYENRQKEEYKRMDNVERAKMWYE